MYTLSKNLGKTLENIFHKSGQKSSGKILTMIWNKGSARFLLHACTCSWFRFLANLSLTGRSSQEMLIGSQCILLYMYLWIEGVVTQITPPTLYSITFFYYRVIHHTCLFHDLLQEADLVVTWGSILQEPLGKEYLKRHTRPVNPMHANHPFYLLH